MAMILDIADAVRDELNGKVWSMSFTAKRAYKPSFDLPEMADLHVTVVPKGLTIAREDRSSYRYDYRVDIGVQQKFEQGAHAELDPLMGLVEEIGDYFRDVILETDPEAVCTGVENGPIYAQEHFREKRLFTSILTLGFRLWR